MKNLFVLIFIFLTPSCKQSTSNSINQVSDIVEIVVSNKTLNNRIRSDTTLTLGADINNINAQLKSIVEISGANVQSNFGYYDIKIIFRDRSKRELEVVQTLFDGIIIVDDQTNKTYKNNEFYNLMLYYLRK